MKKIFFLVALLLLGSCAADTPPAAPPDMPQRLQTARILAVEVTNSGGMQGHYSHFRYTPDSVLFVRLVSAAPENDDSFRRANTPEAWQELAGALNLEGFRAAVEGESVQPVDGVDTEIAILTNKDTITKRNAYENPEWNHVLQHTQILVDKQHVIR